MHALVRWPLLVFAAVNVVFVTYTISLEPIVIPDVNNFEYPVWPPKILVDNLHKTWAANYDRILLARPVWYLCFMWWEQLFFGPYYLLAIYALIKKCNWIRIPSIIWASTMFMKMTVIVSEGMFGENKAPVPSVYIAAHVPYIVISFLVLLYAVAVPVFFAPEKAAKQEKSGKSKKN